MSAEERLLRAHDLGISAFLGDTIYNFGELVSFHLPYSLLFFRFLGFLAWSKSQWASAIWTRIICVVPSALHNQGEAYVFALVTSKLECVSFLPLIWDEARRKSNLYRTFVFCASLRGFTSLVVASAYPDAFIQLIPFTAIPFVCPVWCILFNRA